jgi:serine phosphatase RsbU (regulator of sigma subunit)
MAVHLDQPRGESAFAHDIGHYIVMIAGAEPGKRVEICETPVTIGRSPDQTLAFADSSLSRRHARISVIGGDVVAEDLGSTNGTFVNGARLQAPRPLNHGSVIRVGEQAFRYERRSKEDIRRSEELDRELLKASRYVLSLLPDAQQEGPVRTDWCFEPSAQLGGDAFGYYWLDPETFVVFLLDVSGHGVGAAMHSVAVLDVVRQRALPGVDWRNPAQVLASLNDRFPMDQYNGALFTMWYGVYETGRRMLSYSAGGHHAAYLKTRGSADATPLGVKALMLGAAPELTYEVRRTSVPPDSVLYLFSDGAFEITTVSGALWTLTDFVPLITASPTAGVPESERLLQAIRQAAGTGPLADDCSIVVVTIP